MNKDKLLTNQHILKEKGYLEDAVARFGYEVDSSGVVQGGKVIGFDPNFYYSRPAEELDYALVSLVKEPLTHPSSGDDLQDKTKAELVLMGKHRGYLSLAPRLIVEYDRVNIIQHPDGDPMKVVMTQNYVVLDMANSRVQYVADTMPGSSGAPVFNQKWDVVALHHSGGPYPSEMIVDTLKKAWKGRFRVNEGIPMRAILHDFKDRGLDRYLPRE